MRRKSSKSSRLRNWNQLKFKVFSLKMTEINVDYPNNYFLQIDYFKNESVVAAQTQSK